MTNPDEEPIEIKTTAQFRYALLLMTYMEERATMVKAVDLVDLGYPNTGEDVRVFIGNIRTEASEIGLSTITAGEGMGVLSAMQCVTKIRQGGPKIKSIYTLNYIPTVEQYDDYRVRRGLTTRIINKSPYDQVMNELADLRRLYKVLRESHDKLTEQVAELIARPAAYYYDRTENQ